MTLVFQALAHFTLQPKRSPWTGPHSPVELVEVIARLHPEVEPDKQQEEGGDKGEEPHALPLRNRNAHRSPHGPAQWV